MPNIKSSKKSMIKNEKQRIINKSCMRTMKTSKKRFEQALKICAVDKAAESLAALELTFKRAQALYARAGRKYLIHPNKASRNIASMMHKKDACIALSGN